MHAIIETGGKQYKVAEGDTLYIEKLNVEAGESVTFDKVLAVLDGDSAKFGAPTVDGASVTANVVKNGTFIRTQGFLSEMVDEFRAVDEPIVVVAFGDHKPWLGNSNSVYNALGIDLSRMTKDSFYDYWSTRYLIWANDAAKEVIGHDVAGEGPDISPCFLMNVLFELLGWEGDAYMQAVEVCRRELPMIHRYGSCLTADGEVTLAPTEEQAGLARRFHSLEYYRAHHFSGQTG